MTKDEAINVMQKYTDAESGISKVVAEAHEMAIKAMEQEPCEDCVSRSAVLVLIEDINLKHLSSLFASGISQKAFKDLLNGAQALPPVTPTRKKGHWIKRNNDYFDWYECSECGYGSDGEMKYNRLCDARTKFCPDCGSQNLKGE